MHAKALVIGKDPEQQLKPWWEDSPTAIRLQPLSVLAPGLGDTAILQALTRHVREKPVILIDHEQLLDSDGNLKDVGLEIYRSDFEHLVMVDAQGKWHDVQRVYNAGIYDWYAVGGRWSGSLIPKPDTITAFHPAKWDADAQLFRVGDDWEHIPDNGYNQLYFRDLDVEATLSSGETELYPVVNRLLSDWLGDEKLPPYPVGEDGYIDWETWRSLPLYQSLMEKLKDAVTGELAHFDSAELQAIEFYIEPDFLQFDHADREYLIRYGQLVPQFLIRDGKVERRRMGYVWDPVDNARMDRLEWTRHCLSVITSLEPDTLLTVIDLHC